MLLEEKVILINLKQENKPNIDYYFILIYMETKMFSEGYWNQIHQMILDVFNEEGTADNISSIEEDSDSRCVLVTLYSDILEDEDEVINYHKSLLSSFKDSMDLLRRNPFRKYDYDGYGTITMYVKAENTIKKYDFFRD